MFTVQLVWLIVLVPALIVGAKLAGIAGVGMAQLAIAALLVLPWYLYELRRIGIPLPLLCSNMWLPLVGAFVVGLFAVGVSRLIDRNLVALVVIGPVALITIGMLLRHMKPQLATLRPVLEGNDGDIPAGNDGASDESVAPRSADADVGDEPVAVGNRQASALVREFRDGTPIPASPLAMTQPLRIRDTMPLPIFREAVGPIVTYRDPAGRFSVPRRSDQPVRPGRHRKPEPNDEADTVVLPAVVPASPVNWTDERSYYARHQHRERHDS